MQGFSVVFGALERNPLLFKPEIELSMAQAANRKGKLCEALLGRGCLL